MSESSLCQYCNQLQHFDFCDDAKIALFDSMKARAEKAEAEIERLFKAAWEARELMNLNDPEYAILSKALEPKT